MAETNTDTKVHTDMELSVLIGSDYYWKVVSGTVQRLEGALVALETIFGWCVQGPTPISSMYLQSNTAGIMKVVIEEEERVSEQIKAFWELESLGIRDESAVPLKTEQEAIKHFELTVGFDGDRYVVSLPWRENRDPLADNWEIANKRFAGLLNRFRKNPVLYEDYKNVISEYIDAGIVEPIDEDKNDCHRTYYMPHHAVLRNDKTTTKLRVVFDASSHQNGSPSLNDCLLPGPNINPDLLNVLLKFRKYKIAIMADIEKAFLQISLSEEDRDAVRFLWLAGELKDAATPRVKIFRMTRVLFGVSSSPFLLTATIRHHIGKYENIYPDACKLLTDSLYVDDLIAGADEEDEAFRVSVESKEILCKAGMPLRKWKTNSESLQMRWKNSDFEVGPTLRTNSRDQETLKVLGLTWNPQADEFTFDINNVLEFLMNRRSTKRFVLQASARIFDPIGFLSPFIIRVKCLFQEMWVRNLDWDDGLPDDLRNTWDEWCKELPELKNITVPRSYFVNANSSLIENVELHGFCDASEKAYGAVVYVRYATSTGAAEVSFVTSKTRVVPLKKLTLPRLELMATLIGARLVSNVKSVLRISNKNVHLWTDSTIALFWIRGIARQWKQFVSNRVMEIQELSDPDSWNHCSGKDNPADLSSRGQHVAVLVKSQTWWTGPAWLKLNEDEWPRRNQNSLTSEEETHEMRSVAKKLTQLNCNTEPQQELLDLKKYSSLRRVLRVTAWVVRFVQNSKNKSDRRSGPLEVHELLNAEKIWVKSTQGTSFQQEINELSSSNKCVSRKSRIADLNPFLDKDGLLCLGGRLQQSDLSDNIKHPWILPSKHRFAELEVQYCHELVMHSGLRDTMIQVREKFWIIKGRQMIKTLIGRCLVCKKFRAQPGMETIAPLPEDRIREAPPFQVTGVDFAGPLYLKGKHLNEKSYIALFTCAVTRAVHLELVSNLSTENFLLAFKRFISRRGLCHTIYSDNAKTFKRADQDLKEMWKCLENSALKDFFGSKGITWKYIIPRGAWWGGFWERMVRSVKTVLKKILGRTSLSFEELATTLAEVEAVLNSRPITFTYNDAGDPSPLTPAHFLTGQRLTTLPSQDITFPGPSVTREELSKRLKYRQNILKRFWTRWCKEYLLELRTCSSPQKRLSEHKVDDVVLISEDKIPKHMWKMGRITELYRGRDNKIRSCAVRMATGTILKRPIQLLYHLELS